VTRASDSAVSEMKAMLDGKRNYICRKENISKPRSKRTEQESGFPHYSARVFVIPGTDELCVSQVINLV
jgi:hypothetical protein